MNEVPAITPLLQFIKPGMIGAEIGVQQALSSVKILEVEGVQLFCIDPWADVDYEEGQGIPRATFEGWKRDAMGRLQPFINEGRAKVMQMTSEEAAEQVAHGTLDFAFIDGNHTFEHVWHDLMKWWPRIKRGGFICGHDWGMKSEFHQVEEAVSEWHLGKSFRGPHGMPLTVLGDCWMIEKTLDLPEARAMLAPKKIDLVMFTWDRLEYTLMTLRSLREVDSGVDWDRVNFVMIDHASTDNTPENIRGFARVHPNLISHIEQCKTNRGVADGFEYFRNHYGTEASLIGKIDNDSIFTPGWLRKMLICLEDHPELGIVGAQEGYGENWKAEPEEGYFPANHVGGRFLARKQLFLSAPTLRGGGVWGWSEFQMKVSQADRWKIGWCWPSAVIEHVGDWNERHPKAIKNEEYAAYMERVRPKQYKK